MEEKKGKEGPGAFTGRKKEGEPGKKGPRKDPVKTVLMWIGIILASIFALRTVENSGQPREAKVTFTQFQEMLADKDIKIVKATVVQKGLDRAQFQGEVADAAMLTKLPSLRKPIRLASTLVA